MQTLISTNSQTNLRCEISNPSDSPCHYYSNVHFFSFVREFPTCLGRTSWRRRKRNWYNEPFAVSQNHTWEFQQLVWEFARPQPGLSCARRLWNSCSKRQKVHITIVMPWAVMSNWRVLKVIVQTICAKWGTYNCQSIPLKASRKKYPKAHGVRICNLFWTRVQNRYSFWF